MWKLSSKKYFGETHPIRAALSKNNRASSPYILYCQTVPEGMDYIFIPGGLITDNIFVAYDTMHAMQSKMWSKVGFMGIKLDMSKAYDQVEWRILEAGN
jgi:hypothetical protein